MYKIEWQPKALRQFKKIKERATRISIRDAISELTNFPNCQNVKALSNHKHNYRLRAGRYRILFNAWDAVRIISIEEVKKHDEQTY